jgi:hypothetical protein
MFKIIDHVRTRLAAGPTVEPSAPVEVGIPGSVVFDEELARLRRDWVESHRVFSATPSSERDRAIQAVHVSASAYFDYLDRIRVEDHVPTQVRHTYANVGSGAATPRASLRLAASR